MEYYNLCVDASALATVADSFAALRARVEGEQRLTWQRTEGYLESDWAGDGGRAGAAADEAGVPRYGSGGTIADEYAVRIARPLHRAGQREADARTATT